MAKARHTGNWLEVLVIDESKARVRENVIEVLQGYTVGAAPAGLYGVAVSGAWIEVLQADVGPAKVSGSVIEVLLAEADSGSAGGSAGTVAYGFAV